MVSCLSVRLRCACKTERCQEGKKKKDGNDSMDIIGVYYCTVTTGYWEMVYMCNTEYSKYSSST